MADKITLSAVFKIAPEDLFDAWLNSAAHTKFTGSKAEVSAAIGGRYNAWDGYISGETRLLQRPSFIIQSWRTTDFSTDDPDSTLTLQFEGVPKGTRLTLIHDGLPDGSGEKYVDGWKQFYFKPMAKFFKGAGATEKAAPKAKAKAGSKVKAKPAKATTKKSAPKSAPKKSITKQRPAKPSPKKKKRKAPARAK